MAAVDAEKIFYGKDEELRQIAEASDEATREEHSMSVWQALKKYRKGMFWAFFISLANVLAGFDLQVCGNLVAVPAFQKKYGYEYDPVNDPGSYIITTPWQIALSVGVISAQVVGAICGGPTADWLGRKKPIYFLLLGNTAFVFLEMFATSVGMLFAGEFLNGVCYGFYFVLVPSYASEVVPYHLRNISIGFSNMGLVAGLLLGQGVTTATQDLDSAWAYRAPFALQWFWVVILLTFLWKCPESPWFLVHKGRIEEARTAIGDLAISDSGDETDRMLAMLEKTVRLEKENDMSSTYLDCFKGTNLRRTEISSMPYAIQQATSVFFGQVTYFLTMSGLSTTNAFYMGTGTYALGFLTNLVYYPVMTIVGRRPTYVWGSFTIMLMFLTVGFLDLAPNYDARPGISWAQSVMIVLAYGTYMFTTGPSSWVIMSETSTTLLRSKTVGLGQVLCDIFYVAVAVGSPYEINPDQANWRGKTAFLYAGFAFCGFVWSYFRLPELKGRTYEELDVLFQLRVPAKKFSTHPVESLIGLERNEQTSETKLEGPERAGNVSSKEAE